jgi:hypothetical protein
MSGMTRKDFELIAQVLKDARPRPDSVPVEVLKEHDYVATCFAAKLRSTNPRFDSDRFKRAAGVSTAG